MPVVGNARANYDTWNGAENADGGLSITATFQVTVDDLKDGPQVALTAPGLPLLNDPYAVGNDAQPQLFCLEQSANRKETNAYEWLVVCRYGNKPGDDTDQQYDDEGFPSTDPIGWNKEISITTYGRQKELELAEFIPAAGQNIFGRMPGDPDATRLDKIVTSNGVAVVPPPMIDDSRLNFRVRDVVAVFDVDEAQDYKDAINTDAWQLDHPTAGGLALTHQFQPGECKMRTIEGSSFEYISPTSGKVTVYYRRTFSFDVADNWNIIVPDKGIGKRFIAGNPDGQGNTFSLADKKDGMADVVPNHDPLGNFVNVEVDLDGAGQNAADTGKATAKLEWKPVRNEQLFAPLGM